MLQGRYLGNIFVLVSWTWLTSHIFEISDMTGDYTSHDSLTSKLTKSAMRGPDSAFNDSGLFSVMRATRPSVPRFSS